MSYAFYCNAILEGYRNTIKELSDGKNCILGRDKADANEVQTENCTDINYAWDKLGGMYTFSFEIRRKLMQSNIALLKTLWHLSFVSKKEDLNNLIDVK